MSGGVESLFSGFDLELLARQRMNSPVLCLGQVGMRRQNARGSKPE